MITHEDYLATITVAVCEQYPTTAAALSQVQLVFGVGLRQRTLTTFYRAGGGEADESLPLVEIAAVGGLSPPETCHVVLHELAHVLAPDAGHGSAWRHAARQVGLLRPCAWPDSGAPADWREIAPAIRATLQAIPEPTESLPAEYYDDRLRRAGSGGSRPGSRCAHPSPGTVPESARIRSQVRRQRPCSAVGGVGKYHQGAAGPSQRPTAARRTAVPVARRSPNMLRQPVKRGSSGAAGVGVDRTVASGAQRPHNRFR